MQALSWWTPQNPHWDCDAIICDGAVRSGKTLAMSISFMIWAMTCFHEQSFALCAKTITALRRNLLTPLLVKLKPLGMQWEEKLSRNYLDVVWNGHRNRFYLFGGKDEGSAALIQGMTLAGVLLDEVALMPRSFVEQTLARCSVEGSRFWFNCNPEHPYHWFYTEWIQKAAQKKALYLHFTMEDNPSLTHAIRKRYRSLYSGSFYERFVEGRWVQTTGLVYPQFNEQSQVFSRHPAYSRYCISCDYGTVNPTSMGLWGESDGVWYRLREYYYDARREGAQKTDEEYYQALCSLAGDLTIDCVVVDPSAASFMTCIRRHGTFAVQPARNEVLGGIRLVSEFLRSGRLRFHESCTDTFREFGLYRWSDSAAQDAPLKQHDHAMDDLRYFVSTIAAADEDPFYVRSTARQ